MFACLRSVLLGAAMFGVALSYAPRLALAQDFPNRVVKLAVPNAPGTGGDLVARILAPELSKHLGQQVIIENRPGAGQLIGFEYVAKHAPADGHTLCLCTVSVLAATAVTVKNLRFDPLRDLVPVTTVAEGRFILGSPSVAPWKTVSELITSAKMNPGKLNYGSASSLVRLTTEAFLKAAGIQVNHVPYKDGAMYSTALRVNEVQVGFVNENQAVELADKFRVMAVSGEQRLASFPDAPTFKSLGYPQIPGIALSLNVRLGTPKPAMDKLHAATAASLKLPGVQTQFAKLQWDTVVQTQEAAAKNLAETGKMFAEIARSIGLEPQ